MSYLLIDTLWRIEPIPIEILFHHVCCFALTYSGLTFTISAPEEAFPSCLRIISYMLTMEFTTPFLHASKAFKAAKKMREANIMFFLLLVSWIPIRLWYPLQACKMLWDLNLTYFDHWLFLALCTCMGLCTLQFIWFWKLCVVATKALF